MSKVFKGAQVIIDSEYDLSIIPFDMFPSSAKQLTTIEKEQQDFDELYEKFMKRVEAEKADILKMARQEAEQIKKEAYDEGKNQGYKAGYAEGKKDAYKEYELKLSEINTIKDEIIKEKEKLYDIVEEDAINLVVKICEKVLCDDIGNLKDSISKRVIGALKEMKNSKVINVRVSYDDAETLKGQFSEEFKIIPELRLSKGDFIIETPNGLIDYSMVNMVNKIKDILIEVLKNGKPR